MINVNSYNKVLSICIPVYNNKHLFEQSLKSAIAACNGYEADTEIIISDNCSEDNLLEIVEAHDNSEVCLRYFRNERNIGLAANFLKVVEYSQSEFCWIVGSDDFIIDGSVKKLISLITINNKVDFYCIGIGRIILSDYCDGSKDKPYSCIADYMNTLSISDSTLSIKESKFDHLISPKYNNSLLGSVMCGVFRRSLWNTVNKKSMNLSPNFSCLTNIYPHVYIYSKCMIGRRAINIIDEMVIAGEGAREWSGKIFWDGYLPLIYLKIFNEMIDNYSSSGIEIRRFIKSRLYYSKVAGRYFIPYLISRKKHGEKIHINLGEIFKKNFFYPSFYIGLLKGTIIYIIRRDK